MNQNLKERLGQLINQGVDILSRIITKQDAMGIVRDFLKDDGPEQFNQWKLSSKKVLKLISDEDYNAFIKAEKPIGYDSQPNILKRLIPILKASLDDLSLGIVDSNSSTKNEIPNNISYHIGNVGNMANHNDNSTINQTSTNTVQVIKGDFNSLASKLKDYGVEETDIQNLKNVIDVTPTPTSSDELGEGVTNWLGKMSLKALKGSLKVGKDVAMGVLVDAITTYYCG